MLEFLCLNLAFDLFGVSISHAVYYDMKLFLVYIRNTLVIDV